MTTNQSAAFAGGPLGINFAKLIPAVLGFRSRAACCTVLVLVAAMALSSGECGAQDEDPMNPLVYISGRVTRERDGAPITDCKVTVYRDSANPAWWDLELDATGFYSGRFVSGSIYKVFLSYDYGAPYGEEDEREEHIRSIPPYHHGELPPNDVVCDFAVSPGIIVALDVSLASPSVGGISLDTVPYDQYARPFPQFVRGTDRVVIYPDDYISIWYGDPMPFVGQILLSGMQSFVVASPQDDGHYMQYDCTGRCVDNVGPRVNFQKIEPACDIPVAYSWDDPGGVGWSCFPKTPDDRLPNNPNVHVEAEIPDLFYTTNRNFVRMNGVFSSQDLTPANDHTAVFDLPIPPCGPLSLQLEFQICMQTGRYQWFPLSTNLQTSASDADLVPDNQISLSDIGRLASTMGLCAGQDDYLVCADYRFDNCINTADLGVFSEIWYYNGKLDVGVGVEEAVARFQPTERGTIECIVESPTPWEACVVRFALEGSTAQDVEWHPCGAFVERSLAAPHDISGGVVCDLFAMGPAPSGVLSLGEIECASKGGVLALRLVSLGVAPRAPVDDNGDLAAPAMTRLGGALPNPFNPATVIPFELATREQVSVSVYDVAGRFIRTLVDNAILDAGRHEVAWNGRNSDGALVPSGVYLYRMSTESEDITRRMTLLR